MNSSSSQRFLIFLRQTLQASCEDLTESMTVIHAIFLRRSAHTTPNESSLKDGLKRFTNDFAVLLPYLTHRLVSHTLQTSFAQFSFLGRPLFADFNSFQSVSVSVSVYLFAIIKFNSNYNNNNTFGRQSRKQFAYLKDCFKEWSRKPECKLSLAEQKY